MTTQKEREQEEAIRELKDEFKLVPDDTVYCVLRHVSSSGMSRVIDLFVIRDNQPRRFSYTAAKAVGWKYDWKKEGVRVNGCGMDMGFHLVYSLSHVLFRGDKIEGGAGYALNCRWL